MKTVLLSFLVVLLTACGGSSETKNNLVTELEGTWQSECSQISLSEESYYSTFNIKFQGNEFEIWYDHICTTGESQKIPDQGNIGTFTLSDPITTDSGYRVRSFILDGVDINTGEQLLQENIYLLRENQFFLGVNDEDRYVFNFDWPLKLVEE